jgi:hypothetical protein
MVHGPWSIVHGPWSIVHGPWSIVRRAGRVCCAELGWIESGTRILRKTGERGANSFWLARQVKKTNDLVVVAYRSTSHSAVLRKLRSPVGPSWRERPSCRRGRAVGYTGCVSGKGKGLRRTAENCGPARRGRWREVLLNDEQLHCTHQVPPSSGSQSQSNPICRTKLTRRDNHRPRTKDDEAVDTRPNPNKFKGLRDFGPPRGVRTNAQATGR